MFYRQHCFVMVAIIMVVNFMAVENSYAETQSSLEPLAEFSANPVLLKWNVTPASATEVPTIYARLIENGRSYSWQQAVTTPASASNAAHFQAMHKTELNFRSALEHEAYQIANFEKAEDIRIFKPAAMHKDFVINIGFDQDTTQGFGRSMRFTFNFREDQETLPKDSELGLVFTKGINVYDWSDFRYFEFLYRTDFDEEVNFYLVTESANVLVSVLDFAKEKRGVNHWHEIVIDLDQLMKPEERKTIKALAFRVPMKDKEMNKFYNMYIDDIWLWQKHDMETTQVDATPPTLPGKPNVQIENNAAKINWNAAQEDLSGIEGYSYYFGPDMKEMPDNQIDVIQPEDEIKFAKPKHFKYHYLKVKARNHAGDWSNVIETNIPINPNQ